jgi:alpha-glucuronidase
VLLWFHRVRWDERLANGRTLWEDLVRRYDAGVDSVRSMQRAWDALSGKIDGARYREVKDFLTIQAAEAKWWRDAALAYFQSLSRLPFPPGVSPPAHPLEFYRALRCPANPRKPRCDLQ